jgi:hypothetical protein
VIGSTGIISPLPVQAQSSNGEGSRILAFETRILYVQGCVPDILKIRSNGPIALATCGLSETTQGKVSGSPCIDCLPAACRILDLAIHLFGGCERCTLIPSSAFEL